MLKNKLSIMFLLVIVFLLLNGIKTDDEYIEEEKPRKADEVIKNEYEYEDEQIFEAELASNTDPKDEHIINEEIPTITKDEGEATIVEKQEEIIEENKEDTIPEEDNNKDMDVNYNDYSNTDVNNNDNNNKDIIDEHEAVFNDEQPQRQQTKENIYQYNEAPNNNHVSRPFHVQNEILNLIIIRMEIFVIKIHSQINVYIKYPYDLLCFFIVGYIIASLFSMKPSRVTIQKYKQETDTNIFTLDKKVQELLTKLQKQKTTNTNKPSSKQIHIKKHSINTSVIEQVELSSVNELKHKLKSLEKYLDESVSDNSEEKKLIESISDLQIKLLDSKE